MARFGWCMEKRICFWILFTISCAHFICCRHTSDLKSNKTGHEVIDRHNNNTSKHFRTTILHLEGVDFSSNNFLAFTTEEGVKGAPCNESYFIAKDIPVTSIDSSSGEIEVNASLQALFSTSRHLCIRQQTTQGMRWIHIGKYETYPSSAFTKRDGDS